MSYNIWHSYHPLAGPEYCPSPTNASSCTPQIPLTTRAPHFLQKTSGKAMAYQDRYLIRPQLCFTLDNDASRSRIADVVAYYDHRFHETAALIPSLNMVHPYYVEKFESRETGALNVPSKHMALSEVIPPSSPTVSSVQCHDQPKTPRPSPTLPLLLEGCLASPLAVTPKLEADECCLDSSSSSLTLSPYAPMPLPPIFTYESGSKVMDIPIDTASSFRTLFSEEACKQEHREEKCIPIDPSLASSPKEKKPDARTLFSRGSTAVETLWTPLVTPPRTAPLGPALFPAVLSVPVPAQVDRVPLPKLIPLSVAESQAAELRATGTNVPLTPDFLMQFLGQPKGQTQWHCYIRGCGKQLTRKGHMMDHVRMHLAERSFVCEHCPQTFLRKADCKRHAATHNPTKGYRCGSCTKSYARKDLLTRHTRACPFIPEADRDQPLKNGRKRMGIHASAIANGRDTVNPNKIMGDSKGAGWSCIWGYDEDNKENINPSHFPCSPPAEWETDASDGGRRKRMRTRL